jgi:Ca2+-binding RTX toxin-like protein
MTSPASSAYFDVIAARESGGVTASFGLDSPARYSIVNTFDYLGKYQMGNAALIEAGFYTGAVSGDGTQVWDDTKWTALAHSYGVASRADFLSHPAAQEYAIRAFTDSQWDQLVDLGLDRYVGTTVNGLTITADGLLAGAHLRGADGVYDYLTAGIDARDEYGTPLSEYLALFPGSTALVTVATTGDTTLASAITVAPAADAPVYYGSTANYPNVAEDYISVPHPSLVNPGPVTRIDNVVLGTTGNDTLSGTAGNDRVDGAGGDDLLSGGLGDDSYYVQVGDQVADSGGIDTVYFSGSGFWRLSPDIENIVAVGNGPIDFRGNNDANVMIGGPGDDYMNGRAGDDTMIGNGGNDHFDMSTGRPGNATSGVWTMGNRHIDGGEGIDTIDYDGYERSGVSIDLGAGTASGGGDQGIGSATLVSIENAVGGQFDDTIKGSSGANQLYGRGGNDTLIGAGGNDVLEGDDGNDTYVFGRGDGRDTIRDSSGTDTVQFGAGISANEIRLRRSGEDLIASVAGTSDQLRIENWYLGADHQIEQFTTVSGAVIAAPQVENLLLVSQVDNLVHAMAAFGAHAPGGISFRLFDAAPLEPVIAADSH